MVHNEVSSNSEEKEWGVPCIPESTVRILLQSNRPTRKDVSSIGGVGGSRPSIPLIRGASMKVT